METDVLFVTLDSLALDVALEVAPSALAGLGHFVEAESPATFTLPSHVAFFSGFLPRPAWNDHLLPPYHRLWRSLSARDTTMQSLVPFSTTTILDHMRDAGASVLGFGGVEFFDDRKPSNLLPTWFDDFTYVPQWRLGDDRETGPGTMALLPKIVAAAARPDPFFIFVNVNETHWPYQAGYRRELARWQWEALVMSRQGHATKTPIRTREAARSGRWLRQMQAEALISVDRSLGTVFSVLAKRARRTLVVACSDHGESFGTDGIFGHGIGVESVMKVPFYSGIL